LYLQDKHKLTDYFDVGHWRSWLARLDGIEEVIGSNPICSTTLYFTPTHTGVKYP
jgi:hypothetical protein